jgi:hypothetical protein
VPLRCLVVVSHSSVVLNMPTKPLAPAGKNDDKLAVLKRKLADTKVVGICTQHVQVPMHNNMQPEC